MCTSSIPLGKTASLLLLVSCSILTHVKATEPSSPSVGPISDDLLSTMPGAESGRLRQIVANVIRQAVPETYENEKDWGHQKRIYAGIKIRNDGLKILTKRRWRHVNHGGWTRYKIDLIDPDTYMRVTLHELNWLPDGSATFKLSVGGKLQCFARRSRWNYGVQLWSFHVDAGADIEITITGRIGIGMDYVNIPPDVLLKPEILDAKIDVRKFEVERISDIGGDVAEGIGDALEGLLKNELIKKQESKLVERMNRQITRNEDALRFSMSDWLKRLLATSPKPDQQQRIGALNQPPAVTLETSPE